MTSVPPRHVNVTAHDILRERSLLLTHRSTGVGRVVRFPSCGQSRGWPLGVSSRSGLASRLIALVGNLLVYRAGKLLASIAATCSMLSPLVFLVAYGHFIDVDKRLFSYIHVLDPVDLAWHINSHLSGCSAL